MKRSQKETSFHYYPDTGELVTKKFGIIQCHDDTVAAAVSQVESASSEGPVNQSNTVGSASGWEWDDVQNMYRFYDHEIGQWVYDDRSAGYMKYWLNGQWVRRT